jgi:hypothetical protein
MCLPIKVNRPELVISEGEHLGFEWVTIRNTMGFRCGYVKVEKYHPWYGLYYVDAEVHGGITFAEEDVPCGKGTDDGYWIGFDCGHSCDKPDPALMDEYNLAMHRRFDEMGLNQYETGVIRTQEYVENECRRLATQAYNASILETSNI